MDRHVLVVLTNATEGNDDEFNEWYDNTHLPEVLAVPGFVAAQRFAIGPSMSGFPPSAHRYMALYEIEGDAQAALDALRSGVADMTISPTLDMGSVAWTYQAIGERVTVETQRT